MEFGLGGLIIQPVGSRGGIRVSELAFAAERFERFRPFGPLASLHFRVRCFAFSMTS